MRNKHAGVWNTFVATLVFVGVHASAFAQNPKRTTLSLNGTWQIAEGKRDVIPDAFTHTVRVPGLVSLATPAFKEVGPEVKDRVSTDQSDSLREAFWLRKRFTVQGDVPAIAILKIAKAMFGTRVFLNGQDMGEHPAAFTPGFFNVKSALRSGENELIVRIGSCRDALPPFTPDGLDFEKKRYIPGIYDNVQLMLSGTPHIIRVQTAPDIVSKNVLVQVTVGNGGGASSFPLSLTVKEAKSGRIAGNIQKEVKFKDSAPEQVVNISVPVKGCHLWSPEDPFLYTLDVNTSADDYRTRFGMREFHFDPVTKKAVLNGKPYFMRGSNITLYRFFEDSACGDLPWRTEWVRSLHKSFKNFHWNSLRYCIGLPPEEWYQIADEEGFLIQDEFPIWYGGGRRKVWPKEITADELVKEYSGWMQENWNHPSVVIWDASNETVSNRGSGDLTGEAVWQVRNLDLSNRPWDNSYSPHRAPGDVYESHPYHFNNPAFKLQDVAKSSPVPQGNPNWNYGNFPVIINEYGWLWLNRDGTPTTLTRNLYKNLLGENSTTAQRRHLYALYTAAETEFWRCHRKAAGVLHFTALGYSRGDGQTSDNFIDPAKLQYEAEFLKYVPDAFSPVGVMIDEWGTDIEMGKAHTFRVQTINDLGADWKGVLHLQILKGDKVIIDKPVPLTIPAYGDQAVSITSAVPAKAGLYTVQAVLKNNSDTPVKSVREIVFKEPGAAETVLKVVD